MNQGTSECLNSLPLFTEHELDEECGGGNTNNNNLLDHSKNMLDGCSSKAPVALQRNCSSKSLVLAPFNSTWSDKRMQEEVHERFLLDQHALILDKRVIKYANRVKDLNRQYEMNNNCDLDNGVYNKFVNQSSSDEEGQDQMQTSEEDEEESPSHVMENAQMFEFNPQSNDLGSEE